MSWYDPDSEDKTIYNVVVNHEEQYSIWPAHREVPLGWRSVGKTGPKAECLAYIKEVWTDMRPLSLRKRMEEMAKNPPPAPPDSDLHEEESLVDRLCKGDHRVIAGQRPEKTVTALKQAIDRDYVHVKFIDTKGGTELGFRLDRSACDFNEADFESGKGKVRVAGKLTLDYVPVRCVAEIDLNTMEGTGRLIKVEAQSAG